MGPSVPEEGAAPRPTAKGRFPTLHDVLHSQERGFVVAREVGVGIGVVVVVLGLLWGFTGQPIGRSPIVVVESGSMMHCSNGQGIPFGRDCDSRLGRLGTIDPGDLILVKDIDRPGDVSTHGEGGKDRYGRSGDVIVFRPDGRPGKTPVIHRALFYLEVNGDGTYTIAELGLDHVGDLDDPRIAELGLSPAYAGTLRDPNLDALCGPVGPARSGFITRGDNNLGADQAATYLPENVANCPVKAEWILGKARGEIPWLGLVKLYATDLPKGCPVLPYSTQGAMPGCNYHNAGGDTKVVLFLAVGALLGGPYVYERIEQVRERKKAG